MEALAGLDRSVLLFLNHLGPAGAARELIIRAVATGALYVMLGLLLYLAFWEPGGREAVVRALFSAVLAVAVGKILCQIVPRDRPFAALPDHVRHIPLIVRPDSFPSIHAAAAFGLAGGVLVSRLRGWGIAFVVLATAMGAARVAAGVHWPSDILGGAVIGLLAAAGVAAVRARRAARAAGASARKGEADPPVS